MKTQDFKRKTCFMNIYNLDGEILGSTFCTVKMLGYHFTEHLKVWDLDNYFYEITYN